MTTSNIIHRGHYLTALALAAGLVGSLAAYWSLAAGGLVPDARAFMLGPTVMGQAQNASADINPDTAEPGETGNQPSEELLTAHNDSARPERTSSAANANRAASSPDSATAASGNTHRGLNRVEPVLELSNGIDLAMVRRGEVHIVVETTNRRGTRKLYRATPTGNGFRVDPLGRAEAQELSSRYLGRDLALLQQAQTSVTRTLMSMDEEIRNVSVRLDRTVDERMRERQRMAIQAAGLTRHPNLNGQIRTTGELVNCSQGLDLFIQSVTVGGERLDLPSSAEPCQ